MNASEQENGEDSKTRRPIASWIVIGVFSIACVIVIVIAWWWFFFHTPTAPPTNVRTFYSGSASSNTYFFSFAWENADQWPATFSYELKNSSSKIITSGSTTETTLKSPPLSNGTYTFSISSRSTTWFSVKSASADVTIEFTVKNPSSVLGDREVFAVMGKNSSGDSEYFTSSTNAAAVCEVLGGELATDVQVAEAFNDGADWWAYTWFKNTVTDPGKIEGGYPCWNQSQACSQGGLTKAQIVWGVGGTSNTGPIAGVACWGVKPQEGKSLEIPSDLVDNSAASTFSASSFSACQGRYYQQDIPSENLCACDINTCSS